MWSVEQCAFRAIHCIVIEVIAFNPLVNCKQQAIPRNPVTDYCTKQQRVERRFVSSAEQTQRNKAVRNEAACPRIRGNESVSRGRQSSYCPSIRPCSAADRTLSSQSTRRLAKVASTANFLCATWLTFAACCKPCVNSAAATRVSDFVLRVLRSGNCARRLHRSRRDAQRVLSSCSPRNSVRLARLARLFRFAVAAHFQVVFALRIASLVRSCHCSRSQLEITRFDR